MRLVSPGGVVPLLAPARAGLAAGLVAGACLIASQSLAATDPRLAARLDPETASAVGETIDSAQQRGLPTEPLVARALEGASRQAPGARIVTAVRNLAAGLEAARSRLGARSTPAELVAGAGALAAGVRADTLAALRAARAEGSVVVPLVVLADLVTRRVPLATATSAVLAATRAGVRDADLMRLRERVDEDIRSGVAPANAAVLHTRNLLGNFEPARDRGRHPPAHRGGTP